MNILHVAPIDSKRISGIKENAVNLVKAQSAFDGTRVGLLISSDDWDPWQLPGIPTITKRELLRDWPRSSWIDSIAKRVLLPDLVVFHSAFIPFHARLAEELTKRGIPYIICPRGAMTREALAQKAWKKWLGRRLFFDQYVAGAAAIQFLRQREYERSGDWGRPVIFAGNGVWPPDESVCAHPGSRPDRVFLFLGRLDIHIKGLDTLIEACDRCQNVLRHQRVVVRLVGPDVRGSTEFLTKEIQNRSLGDVVELVEPVPPEKRSQLLAHADLLLQPSRTEGHPTAVIDALAHGLPVLISPETNVLAEVLAARAGWGVMVNPSELARELVRLSLVPGEVLAQAGQAARHYAVTHLSWDRVAAKTLEKYRQIVRVARRAA